MAETPDNYEDQEGMQAQLDYMQGQNPEEQEEIQGNIAELQQDFNSREMGVLEAQEMADYNIPEQEEMQPPMYGAEGMEAETEDQFELPAEEPEFTGAETEGTYDLGVPEAAATEEEPEVQPALPTDEERFEEESGAPRA
ncbi:hypothetical protein ACFL3T_04475 [Patescibacteria group bacterium]